MKKIIIAPHPDDEVIGCFLKLKNHDINEVWYVDYNDQRKKEAKKVCKYFNVTPIFMKWGITLNKYLNNIDDLFYIPGEKEYHPFHRLVTEKFKKHFKNTKYYSVEKNTYDLIELNDIDKKEKEKVLNKFYKSQKKLWKYNKKYIFFETQ